MCFALTYMYSVLFANILSVSYIKSRPGIYIHRVTLWTNDNYLEKFSFTAGFTRLWRSMRIRRGFGPPLYFSSFATVNQQKFDVYLTYTHYILNVMKAKQIFSLNAQNCRIYINSFRVIQVCRSTCIYGHV